MSFLDDDYACDAHDNSNTMTDHGNLFAIFLRQTYLVFPAIANANKHIV